MRSPSGCGGLRSWHPVTQTPPPALYGNVASELRYPGNVISPHPAPRLPAKQTTHKKFSLRARWRFNVMADQTVVEKMSELQVDSGKKVIYESHNRLF